MTMPLELPQRINEALEAMRSHPQHHLMPSYRQAIYEAIEPKDYFFSVRVRGWLALMTAQRVLPLFHAGLPDEPTPRRALAIAEKVLRGSLKANAWLVNGYVEIVSVRSGTTWGHDDSEIDFNVMMAGEAAHRALLETVGFDLLQNLDKFAKLGVMYEDGRTIDYSEPITGDRCNDEELARGIPADTASVAAVASACSPYESKCDPQKLQAFWEWWLTEAIPAAWKKASTAE